MKAQNALSNRVIQIQKGNEDINLLIAKYIPFIKSTVSKLLDKPVNKISDKLSKNLSAFAEAIKRYDATKGKFLSFSK